MKGPYGKPATSAQFDATTGGSINGDTPLYWKKYHNPAPAEDRSRFINIHNLEIPSHDNDRR